MKGKVQKARQNKGERQKYKKTNKTKVKGKVQKDRQNKGERQSTKRQTKQRQKAKYKKTNTDPLNTIEN